MSGVMYAGHLCATQVGDEIRLADESDRLVLRKVIHDGRFDRVRVVVRNQSTGQEYALDVTPRTIVAVDNPQVSGDDG